MLTDIAVKFGRKVQEKRRALGISHERLAELAGVHRTYVGVIERGPKGCKKFTLWKMSGPSRCFMELAWK